MSIATKFGICLATLAVGTISYFAGQNNILKLNKYSIEKKYNQEYVKAKNSFYQIHQNGEFLSLGSLNNTISSLEQRINQEGFTKEEANKTLNLAAKMQVTTLKNTKPGSADPSRITINYTTTSEGSELLIGYKSDSTQYFIPIRDIGFGKIIGGTRKDVAAEGIKDIPELIGEIVKKSTQDLMKDLGAD